MPRFGRPPSTATARTRKFARDLREFLRPDQIMTDPDRLVVFEVDGHTVDKAMPDACVFVESTEDVAAVVRYCNREGIPFTARGAGTGLSGGSLTLEGGVIVELARMRQIIEVDYANRKAVVQPGVINAHLSTHMERRGYYYAPDPSSQGACTIGGNVAENSGGPHTLKYGVTANHILALEVVLPDGTVTRLGGATPDAPGYDLVGLFVGSEGTFGIATEITTRILHLPEAYQTFMAVFETLEDACATVSGIIAAGIIPAALECVDNVIIEAVEEANPAGFPTDAGAVLIIELDGIRDGMAELADEIVAICRRHECRDVQTATDEAHRTRLWKARKEGFGALGRVSPNFYTHDAVVPRSKMAEVLPKIIAIGAKYGFRIANIFHAGDGNLHPNILFDDRIPGETERALECGEEFLRLCIEAGGALTGEHGIGMEKRDFMPWLFTDDDLARFRQVRDVFNPRGLSNPGKVIPTPGRCIEAKLPPLTVRQYG